MKCYIILNFTQNYPTVLSEVVVAIHTAIKEHRKIPIPFHIRLELIGFQDMVQ